jgi:hypothetical protein
MAPWVISSPRNSYVEAMFSKRSKHVQLNRVVHAAPTFSQRAFRYRSGRIYLASRSPGLKLQQIRRVIDAFGSGLGDQKAVFHA